MTVSEDGTIKGLGNVLDQANIQWVKHSKRAARLVVRLGQKMGLPEAGLVILRQGMLLHDIGKTQIPDNIMNKREPLTQEEWRVMKRHPEIGFQIVSRVPYPPEVAEIVRYHHENWDGTGYPQGLCEEAIPLYARMAALVEVWDALRHNLPYRPAWKKCDALAYIKEQAGQKFDPQIVAVFVEMVGEE
jgi:putative nucleotidyltransferase with HDIG domain